MQVHVFEAPWAEFGERLAAIRREVFVDEQNVPEDEEWDGEDEVSTHFLAVNEAGTDLGCARLLPNAQIGRMAVRSQFRKQGIGGDLLEAAVEKAQADGLAEVHLHAQTHAIHFYEEHGFLAEGEEFMDANIPHRMMRRKLAIEFSGEATPIEVAEEPVPPQQRTEGVFFDGDAGARNALCQGLREARRQVVIYSHYLDPTLFDTEPVIEAISDFARGNRVSDLQILIHSSSQIVSRGHRLIELAQRLPSKCSVRQVDNDYDPPDSCFVAWDRRGYWRLPDYREPGGVMRLDDAVRARRLHDTFESLWSRAKADPNLRLLRL